ncbi:MAG: hypothetical protein MK105_00565 [Crocinitomicaceae bacterium]|nr:hypothetical protein [Crocinitomicaceae bacterium]
MRKAVIDLGTNTFNLLIAEVNNGQLNVIYSDKEAVLLGMGGINKGLIAPDALARAKETLRTFKNKCDNHNVKIIFAIGTSALRDSSNSGDLLYFTKAELGFEISIISGYKEADFIYKGVKWGYDFKKPSIVMDIGGGSTEFIAADENGLQEKTSLDIGVSRIFQALNRPEEFSNDGIKRIVQFLEDEKNSFFSNVSASILVGSSGSFETIYEMIYQRSFPEGAEAIELPFDEVIKILEWIITSSLKDRLDNDWIAKIRKRMLPIAAVKMLWVINHFGIKTIYVSSFSLKEGVLND